MSRFLFIHDFYRDGYNDMLAEVQDLQVQGLWTKERRVRVAKYEMSTYHACKHKNPRMDMGYWAGRIAAIKSTATADYPKPNQKRGGKIVLLPFPDSRIVFCGSCGDYASWSYSKGCNGSLVFFRCDRCKQELERSRIAYSVPNGWNWDEDEDLLPLPATVGGKLVIKDRLERVYIFFPSTAIIGLGFFDMALHVPIPFFILQAMYILHLTVTDKNTTQSFRKWLGLPKRFE